MENKLIKAAQALTIVMLLVTLWFQYKTHRLQREQEALWRNYAARMQSKGLPAPECTNYDVKPTWVTEPKCVLVAGALHCGISEFAQH